MVGRRHAPSKLSVTMLGTGQVLTVDARPRRTALPRQSEKAFMAQVIALAELRGWRTYHTLRSKGSPAGFPDLIMIRRPHVLVAELKRDGEAPTPLQRAWLDDFVAAGITAYVWQPRDFPTIERILR